LENRRQPDLATGSVKIYLLPVPNERNGFRFFLQESCSA
jgi:hypothetical protein